MKILLVFIPINVRERLKKMKYNTIREAAEAWVSSFNRIPYDVVCKLMRLDPDEVREITPFTRGDRVYVYDVPEDEHCGEVVNTVGDVYLVNLDDGNTVEVGEEDIAHEYDGVLPMWGTMWAFSESIDNAWLDNEHIGNGLLAMAECGFRIYEQEDYGYIFGIDGAGYSFYESHWIPLYKARGLHWHNEEEKL